MSLTIKSRIVSDVVILESQASSILAEIRCDIP
jgi:hypothetical protein